MESGKRSAELPRCFRYLTVFLFCLCTVPKLFLLLLKKFAEFVIKCVLNIFDDFEESDDIQSVGRGTWRCCVTKNFLEAYVPLLIFIRLKERRPWMWCTKHVRPTLITCSYINKRVEKKNDARWRISDEVWSAWKCDEKLSWVFDLSFQSKLKLRRKQRNKIAKIYAE